jgi:hypothetical protein
MCSENDTIGNDVGSKAAVSGLGDLPIEDQLYLCGPANVQIFPNHVFEEGPSYAGKG